MKKIIIFSILFFLVFTGPVFALTIFSPVIELSIDPGSTQKGLLKIYNETSEDLVLSSSVESYNPEAKSPNDLSLKSSDFLNWFKVGQSNIVLKSSQAILVPFEVSVPVEAKPGGYYAAIFWGDNSQNVKNPGAVSMASQVGTLVFLKINGELKESGEVTDFYPDKNQKIYFGLPQKFSFKFKNQGDIHLKPTGVIAIQNWQGKKQEYKVSDGKLMVLPGLTRQFEINISNNKKNNLFTQAQAELNLLNFGPTHVTLTLDYGENQPQKIIQEISFNFIPINLIILILLALVIVFIFLIINSKINRLKKKN